ncbi:MAG: phosphoglucosamine mutase [Clostridia bacterium]|nr:phosphoglucosamine mutase [Clostridia bacterium]
MDQAVPQIDKILQIADIFHVSCDALLREDIEIKDAKRQAGKYFGTDGFRGESNVGLTSMHAYKVGRFLGWYYQRESARPRIVIGKDTRRSSYMLEYAIASGIAASGGDAYILHVTTTPSVSYVTRLDGFDCGVMITASHNPFYDNGIKVINRYGEKLDDHTTSLIEAYLDGDLAYLGITEGDLPLPTGERIGSIHDHVSGRNRYIGYLISLASNSYKKLRIGLDCANGASWSIARAVFGALGAQLYVIGDEPDGMNINKNCGSTHLENLVKLVREKHLDMGFAFDGDCDRCLAVDEKGNVVDGDKIMYLLAKRLKSRGMLNDNTLVATVMSNSGFVASLDKLGIKCIQTKVGDRFVYECMQEGDYSIGGEQSGHIILKKYATTGDGLLTAIMVCEEICDSKSSLSRLVEDVTVYPQYLKNVRVTDKDAAMNDKNVLESVKSVEALIAGNGRVLLRPSGTEPLIRIMIECESEEKCREYADTVAIAVTEGGYAIE